MSAIKYRLILDRKEAIFYKGELIKGVIELKTELNLKKWLKHVELLGTCFYELEQLPRKWQLKRKKERFTKKELFYTNYCWFDKPADLEKTANPDEATASNESKNLRQRYNFQFQLIEQLPTSCITRNGEIRYEIKLYMTLFQGVRYAGKPIICEHHQPITIIRTLNPNGIHLYEQAWIFELRHLLKCRLNQACFVPGQSIHFVLTLENRRFSRFIQSIVIELQEIQTTLHLSNECMKYEKLQTKHTLDKKLWGNINYRHELSKKQENLQYFDGILQIPATTVPSSNYPIYRQYCQGIGVKIFHMINITIKPRHKWLHMFHSRGHGKLITIGTQPMKQNRVELLRQQDNCLTNSNNFKCLASDHGPMEQAYIPKYEYALKETVLNTKTLHNIWENLN